MCNLAPVNQSSPDSPSPVPDSTPLSPDWGAHESRIVAVEAALHSLAQSGHGAVSRMIRELIAEFQGREATESAAMKRAGTVALQCARVLDSMERRLLAVGTPEELNTLSERFAAELERLREVAYEHLSTALSRESVRESKRFPVVYLN